MKSLVLCKDDDELRAQNTVPPIRKQNVVEFRFRPRNLPQGKLTDSWRARMDRNVNGGMYHHFVLAIPDMSTFSYHKAYKQRDVGVVTRAKND